MKPQQKISGTPESVPQAKLSPVGASFNFACHPGLDCFTVCCRQLDLGLTPYDILCLKKVLGLKARRFLDDYTEPAPAQSERWPMLKLKMDESADSACPFLEPKGCTVYAHRPSACRIYPLGRAARRGLGPGEVKEEYFVVEEAHCHGLAQEQSWAVKDWTVDQGLLPCNEFNDRWMEIVTHPTGPGEGEVGEKKRQMFSLASYNLDRFREFVTQTRFLSLFDLAAGRADRVREDDEELLSLALDWMAFSFFGEGVLRARSPQP
ncbi:MAG: YkgJ family cysteine cluster protein [Deltaproteobacteria bacterium]|nr:YkgJ family cysteine cluster protein [Deltaproteobacteria bacterium]